MAVDKALKIKKKKWIEIVAPSLFNNEFLGESYVVETKKLVGRTIDVSLMQLTRDPKKQSTNIKFRINNIDNNKAATEIIAYEIGPSSIKRLVRRKRDKLEDSFLCLTRDNKTIRVKPLLITLSNTSHLVQSRLRNATKDFLVKKFKKMTFEEILKDLLTNSLHKETRDYVKKLYPLRIIEIRYIGIENPTYKKAKLTLKAKEDEPLKDLKPEEESFEDGEESKKFKKKEEEPEVLVAE